MEHSSLELEKTTTLSVPWYKEINRQQWNALLAAFLGWTLDAFDFILYNFTIVTLIKEWGLTTTQTGMVASITVVASAFGGIFFGFLADRVGRLKALTITVLLYSIATGFCGLSQNLWQLMIARLLVGLGMGGEWSAGAALVAETWPAKHRGKAMSIMQSGYAMGGMLAAAVAGPIIAAYGWRILFFVGVLPALLAWWIRKTVEEPEIWRNQNSGNREKKEKIDWMDLFRGNLGKTTLIGSLFCIVALVSSYPISVWLPAYLGSSVEKGGLGLSVVQSSQYLIPFYIGCILGYWVFGFLSDWIGRKKAFAVYFVAIMIIMPLFIINGVNNIIAFFILITLVGWLGVGYYGGFGIVLSEMYPTRLRASGQGFCYNIARGFTALSITGAGSLAQSIGLGQTLMYSAGLYVFAILALFLLPETKGKELE